jgi:thiamine biosynthesis lipoprotein
MMQRLLFLIIAGGFVVSCSQAPENTKYSGAIFGTYFNITYYSDEEQDHQEAVDSIFEVINYSLSTYIPDSDISRFNRNEQVEVDQHFKAVFKASKKIFKETKGAFDPTIGNVVNAWNFGPDENKFLTDSITISTLMNFVGFDKVIMLEDRFIKPDSVYLDFNAIAKGYAIDQVSEYLETQGIRNYLVDIGGDLRSAGINKESETQWRIGVDDPNFDGSQTYSKIISLSNKGMATSGVYRKFKVDKNGNRYAHIIDTSTGYPTKTNVLSVSVIAPNAMLADGYATAFQAMGVEQTEAFLEFHPELQVYFIVYDGGETLSAISLNSFPED